MSNFGRLTRVMDLFVEGAELELGAEDTGTPVVVWIKKLNSFEDAEARKDGMAARSARIMALKAEDNPDLVNVLDQMEKADTEWIRSQVVQSSYDEDYLGALDDVESEPEWFDKMDNLRRMDSLLREGGVPEDDPRWAELTKENENYMAALNVAVSERQKKRAQENADLTRDELIDKWLEKWRDRESQDEWIAAKQVTEIFYALRDCQAVKSDDKWDHRTCNHGRRLLEERSAVRELPQELLEKVANQIRRMTLSEREAGNSDAPMTSSGSSGQQNAQGA